MNPKLATFWWPSPVAGEEGLLAHQGGWDEMLLVGTPLLLVAGGLWLANRRLSAHLDQDDGSSADAVGVGGVGDQQTAGEQSAQTTANPTAHDTDTAGRG